MYYRHTFVRALFVQPSLVFSSLLRCKSVALDRFINRIREIRVRTVWRSARLRPGYRHLFDNSAAVLFLRNDSLHFQEAGDFA